MSRSQVPLGNAVLTALRSVSIQDAAHPRMCSQATLGNKKKLDYIHCNPVKRGYVDEPVHWRYSSARNYAGGQGMFEISQIW